VSTARQLDVEGLRVDGIGPIDLWLDARECVTLSGPSGAGKTRILRAITDLDVHGGRVSCLGTPSTELKPWEWRRRVGMLAAESHWWRERVQEHFEQAPSDAQLDALALDATLLGEPLERLSSGERQRFALLRLLANRPRVLLLDEPTANLDADNVLRVERLLAEYTRAESAALLWVSHDARQAQRVAQRRLRIEAGRLVAERPARDTA